MAHRYWRFVMFGTDIERKGESTMLLQKTINKKDPKKNKIEENSDKEVKLTRGLRSGKAEPTRALA